MRRCRLPPSVGTAAFVAYGFLFSNAAAAQQGAGQAALEEVIVTAEKRGAGNLQDLAMSAAVITSDLIEQRNLVGMEDYLRTIPSVNYQEYGAGRSTIIIRSISADPQGGRETAATYINETPLTGAGNFGFSSPDLKLIDVNRVEILRGPQGTLYGASSVGGTVRIILELPALDAFTGSVAAGGSVTADNGGGNSDFRGIVNLPLVEDELAVRAVAYTYDYSGYFQNVAASDPVKSASAAATGALALDRDDVASSEFTGGRITARWTPTDQLNIDLMYLRQDVEQHGNPLGDLALGEFRHARYARFSNGQGEFNASDLEMWNLVLEYDFGPIGLVSSSSWSEYETTEDWEVGQFWIFLYGDDAPVWILNNTRSDTFVQELRVSSQWDRPLNFVAGLYFEDQDATDFQTVEWDGDPASDPFGGALMSNYRLRRQFEQLAFFGELSYDISDTLVATLGLRRFDYDTTFTERAEGFLWGGVFDDASDSKEDGYTRKVNIAWSPNEASLYYAQWAEGFRPGEPVGSPVPGCDLDDDGLLDGLGLPIPTQLDSDTLDSYELGSKLSFGGGRVDLRGAVFYNDWKKIPILLVADCAVGFFFNAAEAMTAGVEVEGSARINSQWRIDFSAGYTQAELTSDAPGLGMDGDRLPGTPEFLATLGLQYDFRMGRRDGYVRSDVAAVGGYYNNLQEEGEEIGNYTMVNLAAGLDFGRWDAQLFIRNLTNTDAATWVFFLEEYPSAYRLRPRTIGANLRFRFGDSN